MDTVSLIALYVTLSFVQALFLARFLNKQHPITYPKSTVLLFTLLGAGASAVFLAGLVAGCIEWIVKGK